MKRYSIAIDENGLIIKCRDEVETRIVRDEREISDLVARFIGRGYLVKRYDSFMVLKAGDTSIRIQNYKALADHPALAHLQNDIPITIKRCGYIDKRVAKTANGRVNKERSKMHSGAFVVSGALVSVLLSGILLHSLSKPVPLELKDDLAIAANAIVEISTDDLKRETTDNIIFDAPTVEETNELDYFLEDEIPLPIMEEQVSEEIVVEQEESKTELSASSLVQSLSEGDRGFLPIPDLHNEDKAVNARNLYYDLMVQAARDFGLDPELLLAIGTQERGVHSSEKDPGGGRGLMQIQESFWLGKTIDCVKLNPTTNKFEPYSILVTEDKLQNLEWNIEMGAGILQNCMIYANYAIPVAIQMYNQGSGAVTSIIKTYCQETGKDYQTVLADPTDLGWYDYCHLKPGDPNYLVNVNKWTLNRNYTITKPQTGETVTYTFVDSRSLDNDVKSF